MPAAHYASSSSGASSGAVADDLLERPAALEAEFLGAREEGSQPGGVEGVPNRKSNWGMAIEYLTRPPYGRPVGTARRYVRIAASLPGLNELRALAGRVDTARHHGVPNGCVLEFDVRSVPPETDGFDPLAFITGGGRPMLLRDAVAAIHRAAEDPRVAGLIARVQLAASPPGAVQELREAIAAFTAVKPSLAWAETYPGTLSYYLASAFGEVWMQPSGPSGWSASPATPCSCATRWTRPVSRRSSSRAANTSRRQTFSPRTASPTRTARPSPG